MTTARAEAPRALDTRMRASIVAVAVAGVALTGGALLVFGLSTALSVGLGAAIATANLWVLAKIVAALLPDGTGAAGAGRGNAGAWGVVAALKVLALVAGVWLLMRHGVVSPMPLMVGFGSLPIGIAIGSLVSDRSASA
jgi:hypothetical protein